MCGLFLLTFGKQKHTTKKQTKKNHTQANTNTAQAPLQKKKEEKNDDSKSIFIKPHKLC